VVEQARRRFGTVGSGAERVAMQVVDDPSPPRDAVKNPAPVSGAATWAQRPAHSPSRCAMFTTPRTRSAGSHRWSMTGGGVGLASTPLVASIGRGAGPADGPPSRIPPQDRLDRPLTRLGRPLTPPFEGGFDFRIGRMGYVGGIVMIVMKRFGAVASIGALLVLAGCSSDADAGEDAGGLGEVLDADAAGGATGGGPWPDCELANEFEPC
jgi:hypothetical protein